MTLSLASLLVQETKATIYKYALGVASAVGLPVSSWQPGDPSRAFFHLESEVLATLEEVVVGFINSAFLDYAKGGWLDITAKQTFNVDVPGATYATTSVVLTNEGGGAYPGIVAGDIVFKNSTTGKTYTNTSGGDLASGIGQTLTVDVVADEAGSDSSAAADEIDEILTSDLTAVSCSNPTAAVGNDKQVAATTIQQCRDKLGSFSPNGPREAYAYVARNAELTGTSAITRVRVYPDSDTGDVLVYLAGPSGEVIEADRALVEAAILKWATPLCITPTVASATAVTVAVTYTLWVYTSVNKTAAEIEAEVEDALAEMLADRPIGGDTIVSGSGYLYTSLIESTIRGLYEQAFRVSLSVPAADVAVNEDEVLTLGTVTATVILVTDPLR